MSAEAPEADAPVHPGPARSAVALDLAIQAALIVAGALALCWPAFDNGYPLVYQDTQWYLVPSVGMAGHPGRAVGYSAFAAAALAIPTHWSIVVAQSLVTGLLLVRNAWIALPEAATRGARAGLALAGLGAVLLLSGGAKYTSWLMADVTTPWLFLAGLLWMQSGRAADRVLALATGGLALAGHNSNLPVAAGTALVVAAGAFAAAGPAVRRRAAGLLALVLVAWAGLSVAGGGSRERGSSASAFLLYSLSDSGVLSETLDAWCGERDWVACDYREAIAAHVGEGRGWILFDPGSPLPRAGGWGAPEVGDLVLHAFRCCWTRIVTTTLAETWTQLWTLSSRNGLRPMNTQPMQEYLDQLARGGGSSNPRIASLAPAARSEAEQLRSSRQARPGWPRVVLHPFPERELHGVLLALAAALSALAWSRGARGPAFLLGALFAFFLANAFVCAFANTATARFQGRIAWLLPWALVIAGVPAWKALRGRGAGKR